MPPNAFREALLFAGVGLVNTALSLSVIWIASRVGMGPYLANMAGYAVGLINSFFMNRAVTFRKQSSAPGAASRFLLTFAVAYVVNLTVLTAGLSISDAHEFLWQILAMITYTVVFFTLSKWFVFR